MANLELTPSLAGTDKKYVVVFARVSGDNGKDARLHLQGTGPKGNRPYGVSADCQVSSAFAKWFGGLAHLFNSKAGGSAQKYRLIRARLAGDVVRFQADAPTNATYNRPYGAAFMVSTADPGIEPLVQWLKGISATA